MNLYKKNSIRFQYLSLITGIGFLFFVFLTPLLYIQYQGSAVGGNVHGTASEQRLPITSDGNSAFITSTETENEFSADAASYHLISRGQSESRLMPSLVICAFAILVVGFCILLRNSRYLLTGIKQRVCVLSVSLGGHAPPVIYCR